MTTTNRPGNLRSFRELAPHAERNRYAVGAFSPRYPLMIEPVLRAAQALESPLLVQISQKDMIRCHVGVEQFAGAFYACLDELVTSVPVGLHLDHTHDPELVLRAMDAGFTSVMIDASHLPLEENIAVTREIADRAHELGISVEAELGTIGASSFSETEESEQVTMTDPEQVPHFVRASGVDALAVSVGTFHGIDSHKRASIDFDRLEAIRARCDVHLVLHGGSGIDGEMMRRAIDLPGGGVSKVNLATDLEVAMLEALGSEERMVDEQIVALSPQELQAARRAVEEVTRLKIRDVLGSEGMARSHPWNGR